MKLHDIGYFQTGHVLQFETEIEINCDVFNFEAYVKLCVFDESMCHLSYFLSMFFFILAFRFLLNNTPPETKNAGNKMIE